MLKFHTLAMVLLFPIVAHSQQNGDNYAALWEKVQKLEGEALTQSALKIVQTISDKADQENNSEEGIKALLYISKYTMVLQEDAQFKIVNDFKRAIQKAEFPVKNILESYLANLYWQYFQENRHQFYERSATTTRIDSTDFRTWDLTSLFKKINEHFKASLENPNALQQENVDRFDKILIQRPGSDTYRPTLYDILAHTALTFYTSDETAINRPSDKFEIIDPSYLREAYNFIQLKIAIQDETSLQSRALLIYQTLLQFHFSDPHLEAFVDVDIERLTYSHQQAVFEGKDEQLLETLRNSAKSLSHNPVSGLYEYEIAKLLRRQGNRYDPKSGDDYQWKQQEALELCESVIARFPDSRAANRCRALKSEILSQDLRVTIENYVPVNSISRMLVRYRNLSLLGLTAYTITPDQWTELMKTQPGSKQLAFIENLPTVKSWMADVKNESDYQEHSTEIEVPGLPNGQYLLMAARHDKANGKTSKDFFAFGQLQVTNMALIATKTESNYNFQVIDRRNGAPISDANLKVGYLKNYNKPVLNKQLISNDLGQVQIPLPKESWSNVSVHISHGDENAYFDKFHIDERFDTDTSKTDNTCFLFTDRSIYRPGQTVYFKGIAVQKTDEYSAILKDTEVNVTLHNVNGQNIASQVFTTNTYGSFSGEFILPRTGLSGNFSVRVTAKETNLNGYSSFSVESYKRPQFETSFNPIQGSYKLGDTITLKGKAVGYAGSAISDASVSYRVKRVVILPWWYHWRRPYYQGSPQEITHGLTTTDDSGGYQIRFKAMPDKSVSKDNLPIFQYEILADVTDINGETHSTSTIVNIGYHTLKASIDVPDIIDRTESPHIIEVNVKNLNGQSVPAHGTLKMFKLKAPNRVLRERPWPSPDYKGWPEEEFKALFPHDAFDREDNAASWEKEKLVWQNEFNTQNSTKVPLKTNKRWESGKYMLELETTDSAGNTIKELALLILYGRNDTKIADNQLFQIKTDKENYAVGDHVKVTLQSAAKNLMTTIFVEKDGKIVDTYLVRLNRDSKTLDIPVTENDLGGFAITYSFSAFNAFQSGSLPISVPYRESSLQIETLTFRDKLRPGSQETWSFKVKGPTGEKVTAEFLASMYDASLDTFRPHSWRFSPLFRENYYSNLYINAYNSFGTGYFSSYNEPKSYNFYSQGYDSFDWFGFNFIARGRFGRNTMMHMKSQAPQVAAPAMELAADDASMNEVVTVGYGRQAQKEAISEEKENQAIDFEDIQVRKNLQETAFFFPKLMTDMEGNVSFTFTSPEALTEWKLQLLAYTQKLESSVTEYTTVTQKELMVVPNVPRFVREQDEITISSKISNLTSKSLSGTAQLILEDGLTGDDIASKLLLDQLPHKQFSVDSLGNTQVSWRLHIPEKLSALKYSIVAKAGNFSDGQQNLLPVLSNRILVTETLPMSVRKDQTKTFILDKLKNISSNTLSQYKLTLEITSNPAWYAVQALPYLMEYPHECNEQIFARYYGNTLASHIANSHPRLQEIFKQWADSDALVSTMEKNEDLKSLLIQETPWLRDAQSETEQQKRIGLLFDLNNIKDERLSAMLELSNNQKPSGAWAWFKGGPDNRRITQHIVAGLGHLKKLNVDAFTLNAHGEIIQNAISYLDSEFVKEYDRMKKHGTNLEADNLSRTQIHYLYMRSFFKDIKTSNKVGDVAKYYLNQAQKYWMEKNLSMQGMLAMVFHRNGNSATAQKIIRSLEENSITSEEYGMYWKQNTASWHWYEAPIETQAFMIEAFSEIYPDDMEHVNNLKIWLLKNKQTNQWKSTKATTEAIYALLLQGNDWLSGADAVDVSVGGEKIVPADLDNVNDNVEVEAATGYYKTAWKSSEINPKMAVVQLKQKGEGISWGALYWQYFEDLDKITASETPLKLNKKLFLKSNTDTGEQNAEITRDTRLSVGDLIRVRIELRSERDMEYIHMKDMRAAGLEPISVLSRHKWQDGLGYYESTQDASIHFFFDHLPKGAYVFEYDLRVNNAGTFGNGITTIQSMYAPEFNSHSQGNRIFVDN